MLDLYHPGGKFYEKNNQDKIILDFLINPKRHKCDLFHENLEVIKLYYGTGIEFMACFIIKEGTCTEKIHL